MGKKRAPLLQFRSQSACMGPRATVLAEIRFCSLDVNSRNFSFPLLDPAVAAMYQRKQTPARKLTAGQLTGRLQANNTSEKRALLALAHRAPRSMVAAVFRAGSTVGVATGPREATSAMAASFAVTAEAASAEAAISTRGAGSVEGSGPASTEPAKKREPRRLAAEARFRHRLVRHTHVHAS